MAMNKGQSAERTITVGTRASVWWLMRKNKQMTLNDILMTLRTNTRGLSENNVRRWLTGLAAAGIIERVRIPDGKKTSNGVYLYKLVVDISPKAPVLRKGGEVFNPNTGQVYWPKEKA